MYNNPLSPSSINMYLECPYRFWLRYFKKIVFAQAPAAMFGSVVHKVNELFWPEYEQIKEPTIALQASIAHNCPELPNEYEEPAHDCFNNFLKIVQENPKLIPLYTELKLKNPINDTVSIVDVVYPHKIVDYKTSTQYTIKAKQPNIIQAAMCSMNLMQCMHMEVRHVEFQYLRFKKYQYVDVTNEIIATTTNIIDTVRTKINGGEFPKNKTSCFFCDYKLICQKEDDMIKRNKHV